MVNAFPYPSFVSACTSTSSPALGFDTHSGAAADRASGSLPFENVASEVWVDGKSQVDPESPESPEPRAQSPEPRAQSPEPRELSEEQSLPSSPLSKKSDGNLNGERMYARKLCLAAKSQVMDMFQEARQGRRPKHDVAAGRRNRCLGAANLMPSSASHASKRTTITPALGCRLRPDAIAGPASRSDEEQTRLAGIGGLMHDLARPRCRWKCLTNQASSPMPSSP